MWHDIDTWRSITLGFGWAGQTMFVLLYMTFPWWKNFLGRALFYKALMLGLLMGCVFFARMLGLRNLDWAFVALYGLLGVGTWWQFFAFLSVKRRGHSLTEETDHD